MLTDYWSTQNSSRFSMYNSKIENFLKTLSYIVGFSPTQIDISSKKSITLAKVFNGCSRKAWSTWKACRIGLTCSCLLILSSFSSEFTGLHPFSTTMLKIVSEFSQQHLHYCGDVWGGGYKYDGNIFSKTKFKCVCFSNLHKRVLVDCLVS